MKKTLSIIAISLALLSCSKQEENACPVKHDAASTFLVNIEDGATKVAVGEKDGGVYPLSWETGDRLIINYTVLTNPLDAAYNGLKSASFTTTDPTSYPATLVYPDKAYGGAGYILIPAEQAYDPLHPGNGYGLITGTAVSDGPVALKHASAYIRIPLTGSTGIKSVILSAPGAEILAGRFSVDGASGNLTHVPSPAENIESSSCIAIAFDRTLSSSATDFVFAVPACNTYSKGLRLTVLDVNNRSMVKTMYSSGGKKFDAGIVYEFDPLEYVPGGSEEALVDVSESAIEFPGTGYSAKNVVVTTLGEGLDVRSEGLEWTSSDFPSYIAPYRTYKFNVAPDSGNPAGKREGRLTFTGRSTGVVKELKISQKDLYTPSDGFPCRWYIKSDMLYSGGYPNAVAELWQKEGICTPNEAGKGYVSATSADGTALKYEIAADSSTKTLCIGNLGTGDCINWSVPVTSVAAGTDFDFMVSLNANSVSVPKYWVFEWLDGDEWKCDPSRLYPSSEDASVNYSIYLGDQSASDSYCTYIQSFTLSKPVSNAFVRMRLRAVGNVNAGGKALVRTENALVYLIPANWRACTLTCYHKDTAIKDKKKLSAYGNSFTYINGSMFLLKELCRKGGHQLDMRVNLKAAKEFEHHLNILSRSQSMMKEGGYDWVILQDGSYFHAQYGSRGTGLMKISPKYSDSDILRYTRLMSDEVRKYSPDSQIILENQMSFRHKSSGNAYLGFGSYDVFDQYSWKGVCDIVAECPNVNWISPIGKAVSHARKDFGFMSGCNNMEHTDNYHPGLYASYVKACVDYLIMFGDDFGPDSDCGIPSADATKLRQAARDIIPDAAARKEYNMHP